jgi:hypothetical protein
VRDPAVRLHFAGEADILGADKRMHDAAQNMPHSSGFLKVNRKSLPSLSKEQRTTLIRRGNEFFNQGKYAEAKRIFLTVGYTDGLVRLGDHFFKQNKHLEALRLYWLAPDSSRIERLLEQMAGVVRQWLKEDESNESSG